MCCKQLKKKAIKQTIIATFCTTDIQVVWEGYSGWFYCIDEKKLCQKKKTH